MHTRGEMVDLGDCSGARVNKQQRTNGESQAPPRPGPGAAAETVLSHASRRRRDARLKRRKGVNDDPPLQHNHEPLPVEPNGEDGGREVEVRYGALQQELPEAEKAGSEPLRRQAKMGGAGGADTPTGRNPQVCLGGSVEDCELSWGERRLFSCAADDEKARAEEHPNDPVCQRAKLVSRAVRTC